MYGKLNQPTDMSVMTEEPRNSPSLGECVARPPQIQSAFDRLINKVGKLAMLHDAVEKKCSPILRPIPTVASGSAKPDTPMTGIALADAIDVLTRRLDLECERTESFLDRVEV